MNEERTLTLDIRIKGDDNRVIGQIEKQVNVHYDSNIHRQYLPLVFEQSHSIYSVLVCNYSDDNVFQLAIESSSYCKETAEDVYSKFGVVDESTGGKIGTIPTILLRPSKEPKDKEAMFGFVTSIERSANQLIMGFFLLTRFPLEVIYENMDSFGIRNARLNHALENEMYSFHDGDVVEILRNCGIVVPKL